MVVRDSPRDCVAAGIEAEGCLQYLVSRDILVCYPNLSSR
jgi:quinol monooxygenase YgiN